MLVCWLILLRKLGIIAAVRRLVTRDCCSLYITVIEATGALSNFETCDGMRPDRSLDTLDTVSEARSWGEGFSFHICSSKKINLEKFWNIISTDWPVKLSSSSVAIIPVSTLLLSLCPDKSRQLLARIARQAESWQFHFLKLRYGKKMEESSSLSSLKRPIVLSLINEQSTILKVARQQIFIMLCEFRASS